MTCCHKFNLRSRAKRFFKGETGSMVVPFALWTPVFLGLILSSVELGTITIRQTALDRALDETVREVKLGTVGSHDALKAAVCEKAAVLPNCTAHLHLEMLPVNLRDAWGGISGRADCVDTSQTVTPNRNFRSGSDLEVMFLRACYKYKPITPAGTISSSLRTDDQGYTAIVSTSAYVQEPS